MDEEEKMILAMQMGLIKGVEFMPKGSGFTPETPLKPVSGVTIDKIVKKAIEVASTVDSGKCYFEFSGGLYFYDDKNLDVKAVNETHGLLESTIRPALEKIKNEK